MRCSVVSGLAVLAVLALAVPSFATADAVVPTPESIVTAVGNVMYPLVAPLIGGIMAFTGIWFVFKKIKAAAKGR